MSCPHDSLSYSQQQQVRNIITASSNTHLSDGQKRETRDIVDGKLSAYHTADWIQNLVNQINLREKVKDEVDRSAPRACQDWVDRNLDTRVGNVAEKVTTNTCESWMHKYATMHTRSVVDNYMTGYLQGVKAKVDVAANEAVNQIVDDSKSFQPIFNSHLSILSKRFESSLNDQMFEIKSGKKQLDQSLEENRQIRSENTRLKNRVEKLEESNEKLQSSNSTLTAFSAINLASIAGLSLYVLSKL
jgi:hypothetical protein